ncbi:enoyl-CoA hydratase-related protein [Ideonella sp. B508-1]|uniref:enoyl-CoA hydratase-related protein n=1 Tax=Ideonella sp. B508-1 TaxID=137716 RepID=UPI00034C7DD5|nr:enoyl-CoA hydratase-related protein [Ideonella sp. B508-1]
MSFETILYDVAEDGVCTVTLNRPEALNTVTFGMIDELIAAIDRADRDDAVRVIIVTGAGRVFSGGTDLSRPGGFGGGREGYKPLQGGNRDSGGALTIRMFDAMKPVIGAINGPAVGIGATMLLPMDIRIAAATARFAFPFVRRGILPESCSSWFLPRMVGISRALAWTVTGRTIPVAEALSAGLVHEVVEPSELLPRARAIAHEIARECSPLSVALTRQAMWRGLDAPHPIEANRIESRALAALVPGGDTKEGVAAFREKRSPEFGSRVPRDLPDFVPWWPARDFDDAA